MFGELTRAKDECEEVSKVITGVVHRSLKGLVYKESGLYPVGSETS